MAPERLKRNIGCLHLLSNAKKRQRDALINTASKDQILCICDCAHNFLNSNVPFSGKDINKLRRYQNQIRYLANNKQATTKQRKDILIQNGGFLPLLLTPILSIVGGLLADAITGRK